MGDRLRGAGLRRTPVRVAVLQRLAAARKPLAANDVIARLGPHTDAVTVYRTLNTLAEHNLLHRVRGEDGAWRYATTPPPATTAVPHGPDARPEHPHAHFVCDECGGVECLEELPVPPDLLRRNRLGRRYDVRCAEVVVHGTCPKCHD
ncbi:MAG TPA: Fur family transcriptional regulator [Tepidisphaeraceae bacterium]|jgi:Fe2+ or Zn2+ uptake regulation protein